MTRRAASLYPESIAVVYRLGGRLRDEPAAVRLRLASILLNRLKIWLHPVLIDLRDCRDRQSARLIRRSKSRPISAYIHRLALAFGGRLISKA